VPWPSSLSRSYWLKGAPPSPARRCSSLSLVGEEKPGSADRRAPSSERRPTMALKRSVQTLLWRPARLARASPLGLRAIETESSATSEPSSLSAPLQS